MKVRILKDQKLKYLQQCTMASIAAIKALDTLELEGYYTDQNSDRLWETAWSTADRGIVCEDASIEEATFRAEEAARRHAKAIVGGNVRLAYIKAGKINPAWRVQLAQLAQ